MRSYLSKVKDQGRELRKGTISSIAGARSRGIEECEDSMASQQLKVDRSTKLNDKGATSKPHRPQQTCKSVNWKR